MATHTFHEQFPLPSDEQSIRVLCIQPGVRGTTIEASLSKIDLNDPKRAPYTTLSYTWGDAAIVDYVLVNDEKIGVGVNLFQALQHIRSPNEPIVIWVDAICIDQADDTEKSHQVSHMGLVYRLCKQVYIWLGSPDDSYPIESNPFAFIEHMAANKHIYELPGYHKDEYTDTWAFDFNNTDCASIRRGFRPIAQSSWWHRAWTVQEVVLPAKAVVIYGSWRTAWKNFDRFTVNAHQHTNSITRCCADAFIATGWEIRNFTDAISSSNYTIGRTRRRKGRLEMFIEVSLEYMDRQCVDPRDKIYSLLGLYDPGKIRLYPDYTKEVSEVYTETFCRMIEEAEMSPQCLLGQGFNSEKFNLPSWVHDFSAVYDPRDRFWHAENAYPLYEACGDLPGKLEVKDRRELLLHGILIDRVKVVATETFTKPPRRCFENWPKTCDENGVPIRTNQAYEMFTRVMCGDIMKRTGGYERPSKENDIDLPTDDAWSEFWATGNRYIFPEQYRRIYTNVLRDKTLYVTTSGRVGLSFPYIKAGDEVWVIHGSNVPFILRRQSETPAHHRLVGDTYLHGVMHGSCARREDSVEVVLV